MESGLTAMPRVIGEKATPLDDAGTRPFYYGGADNPYECIKVLEAWLSPLEFYGWLRGTIIKYQSRTAKDQAKLDNSKTAWYSRYLAEWLKRTGFDPLKAIQAVTAATKPAETPAQISESIAHHSE